MFDLTKAEYDELKEKLMLNEELSKILEMKIKGYSITQISILLNISERTTNRRIKALKKKITRVIWLSFFLAFFCRFIGIFINKISEKMYSERRNTT